MPEHMVLEQSIRIKSFDGASISASYQLTGHRDVLVFVHGLACSQYFWSGQLSYFAATHDLIVLDLAGHGESDATERDWTIENFARDVAVVLDHFNVADAWLVGHSMGGAVALEVFNATPSRHRRIIGIDTFTYQEIYPRVDESRVVAVSEALQGNFADVLCAALDAYFLPNGDPRVKSWVLEEMLKTPAEVGVKSMQALLRWDLDAALKKSREPPVCINSAELLDDAVVSHYRERLQVIQFVGGGHFLMLDAPERFNRVLGDCLSDASVMDA
jgi:pimeloyl-ACP methyl ester carboxylesterase